MNIGRLILSLLALAFGIFMFIYGGFDDSPGGQLLGVLFAVAGIAGVIQSRKKE